MPILVKNSGMKVASTPVQALPVDSIPSFSGWIPLFFLIVDGNSGMIFV